MPEPAQDFQLLQALFDLIVDLPADERETALASQCKDPELRQRVVDIMAAAEIPEAPKPTDEKLPFSGRIGPYRLLQLLGSGGLGSVYLAERFLGGAPFRVALKMLAPHAAGPLFVERFQREQHILATLDHPHITKLLDAGLGEAGHPYLAMEYVNGQHLDTWCDTRKLSVADRIGLMLQVCDAVGYAHRMLVVHLDLKPSNILVTDQGSIKLLDFGTSKLIQPDSLLTTTLMVTPAFASPEQLRNEAVSTACDVYSLGAILFELLVGNRPASKSSASLLFERAMNEAEPDRLDESITPEGAALRGITEIRLRQMLKGDLAVITAKCLRPRARDRYLSVDALAEDLRRYLAGRTVLATPQTTGYRVGKFVRRNRKAVLVSALASMLLLARLAYAVVRQQQALREAERAVEMQTFMAQLFKLASTNYMGKPAATVPEFLRLGSQVLPQMIKNPADQRAGELSLAESMFYNADFTDAETLLARIIAEAKAGNDIPTEAEAESYAGMVAYKLNKMPQYTALSAHALQLASSSDITPATRVWIESFYTQDRYDLGYTTDKDIAIQQAAYKEAHNPAIPPNELAFATLGLAMVTSNTASIPEQQKLVQQALAIYQGEPYSVCETAAAEQILAFLDQQVPDTRRSIRTFNDSLTHFRQCHGADSRDALMAQGYLGLALISDAQDQQAIPLLEATVDKMEKTIGPDNMILNAPLVGLGRSYMKSGQYQAAETTAVKLFHVLDGKINPISNQMGICQLNWARALAGQGKFAEALPHALLSDKAFSEDASKLPGVIANAKRAHQMVLDLQANVTPKLQ